MRKLCLYALSLFIISSCAEVRTPLNSSTDGDFTIYLLADNRITVKDASMDILNSLILATEPLISAKDIIQYTWHKHSIQLSVVRYP